MPIQNQPDSRLRPRPTPRVHLLTHDSTYLTARPSSLRLMGRSFTGQCPTQLRSNGTLTQSVPNPTSTTSPERSVDMCPSRTCLALLLSLMLLAGLAGCGPAASDNALNLESRASVGGPPLSKQGPSPRNDPFTPAASPVPLASGNETGATSGRGTIPRVDSPHAVHVPSSKPADPVDALVVPAWMAKELDSPDVGTRLRALEIWVQSAPPGTVDPLILAFEDKDERVRARAMELIEQDWAREPDAEK